MSNDITVAASDLQLFLYQMFAGLGMTTANAQLCSQSMVTTNLWGIDSHGLLRMPIYAKRLMGHVIKANPEVSTIAARGGFEVMDGNEGMGFLVGHAAMERAIALAKEYGIGAVSVTNSNHFGAAALYARQATDQGMLALSMTNVTPNLVVPGGSKPITGNNPIAFGAPTRLGFPFLLDISMSSVAGGKLLLAEEKGEKIPMTWATDRSGKPTDDPRIGFEGFLLPLGGHKGFGLSLMVDILCGVISGGAFQFDIKSMYGAPDKTSDTGHMVIAIDPTVLMGASEFLDRMDSFYQTVKNSPMWDDRQRMYIPGEIEHQTMARRQEEGLPMPRSLVDELVGIARTIEGEAMQASIDQFMATTS
ncbi:Ldh family oxidoreductase [Devosia algicola]|uniref:Ldh family oxidoreductase n=1 Tax=Devosia algicola TaxID=3026418 RepID=A0ABY7YS37_9HYPH|nr:Ldh family oxidoreductase [Devosia algicola]WDR03880.1 Ldh family oxidoreductase [Devosia algicola]